MNYRDASIRGISLRSWTAAGLRVLHEAFLRCRASLYETVFFESRRRSILFPTRWNCCARHGRRKGIHRPSAVTSAGKRQRCFHGRSCEENAIPRGPLRLSVSPGNPGAFCRRPVNLVPLPGIRLLPSGSRIYELTRKKRCRRKIGQESTKQFLRCGASHCQPEFFNK